MSVTSRTLIAGTENHESWHRKMQCLSDAEIVSVAGINMFLLGRVRLDFAIGFCDWGLRFLLTREMRLLATSARFAIHIASDGRLTNEVLQMESLVGFLRVGSRQRGQSEPRHCHQLHEFALPRPWVWRTIHTMIPWHPSGTTAVRSSRARIVVSNLSSVTGFCR